jgi:phosphatidylethanolamine/phosphatidyl-N-methylethanolamine N-methyltransferase
MVVVGKNSPHMLPQGLSEVLEYSYAGVLGSCDPLSKMGRRSSLVRHGPQESEIFLHVVCGSQGFVDGECLFEAGSFVAVISEVFGILQEQPTGTFEDILLEKVSSFPIQFTPQLGQFLIHELDHVEVIEHDGRMGQIAGHGGDVGLGHVHCNGLDTCSGGFESSPERFQGIGTLAFTDEDHCPTVKVEHDCEVSMPSTNTDLINGDALEGLQRRVGEVLLQRPLLNLFNRVLTDPEVVSHILHAHVPGKLENIALESSRVSPIGVSKGNSHLPDQPTRKTPQSRNVPFDVSRPQPYRECIPHAADRPFPLHCSAPTIGAHQRRGILIDVENRAPFLESRPHMMDSPSHNPKTVVEYTRGHDFLAFSDFAKTKERRKSCPLFIYKRGTHLREEPNIAISLADVVREVDGVDPSPLMLQEARVKAEAKNLRNVRFSEQDAYGLKFPDGTFDAVIISHVLHIIDRPDLALSEARRVLKNGGLLIAPTYCHGLSRILSFIARNFLKQPVHFRFTPSDLVRLVRASGFEVFRCVVLQDKIPVAFLVARLS